MPLKLFGSFFGFKTSKGKDPPTPSSDPFGCQSIKEKEKDPRKRGPFAFLTGKGKGSKSTDKSETQKTPPYLDPARHVKTCPEMNSEDLTLNLGTSASHFSLETGTWINHVTEEDEDQVGVEEIIRLRRAAEESEADIELLRAENEHLVKKVIRANMKLDKANIEVIRVRGLVSEAQNPSKKGAGTNGAVPKRKVGKFASALNAVKGKPFNPDVAKSTGPSLKLNAVKGKPFNPDVAKSSGPSLKLNAVKGKPYNPDVAKSTGPSLKLNAVKGKPYNPDVAKSTGPSLKLNAVKGKPYNPDVVKPTGLASGLNPGKGNPARAQIAKRIVSASELYSAKYDGSGSSLSSDSGTTSTAKIPKFVGSASTLRSVKGKNSKPGIPESSGSTGPSSTLSSRVSSSSRR